MVLYYDNMTLDEYSGGLAIKPLMESMGKLSYGEAVETFLLNIYSLNNLKFSSQEGLLI